MTPTEFLESTAFVNAVTDPENINENGTVNWDFVEADLILGLEPVAMCNSDAEWNVLFDATVSAYLARSAV